MNRSILAGLLFLTFAAPVRAQADSEEAAIRAALEH